MSYSRAEEYFCLTLVHFLMFVRAWHREVE
jgi:hypothetical protein